MTHIASYLSKRHVVRLVTLEAAGTPSFFAPSPSVEVVQLDLLHNQTRMRRLFSVLARFPAARRQLKSFEPDVVVSFMDTMNIMATIVSRAGGVPVVISERIDPAKHRIGAVKSLVRNAIYALADCCVVQTERVRAYFAGRARIKLAVIPNPVMPQALQATPATPDRQGRFRIVALGRLEPQKGFDRLIEAFAALAPGHPDWDLVMFGEGVDREALEARIGALGLGGRAFLPGLTAEAGRELAVSHIMAFPSRYEGFPNALAEGLAAGLPAVGYTGVSGVEDLIVEGETGLLIDPAQESAGLAEALGRLIGSAELRTRLGDQARRHMDAWRPEVVCQRWETLLAAVAKKES